jgi:hypothetical protein
LMLACRPHDPVDLPRRVTGRSGGLAGPGQHRMTSSAM